MSQFAYEAFVYGGRSHSAPVLDYLVADRIDFVAVLTNPTDHPVEVKNSV